MGSDRGVVFPGARAAFRSRSAGAQLGRGDGLHQNQFTRRRTGRLAWARAGRGGKCDFRGALAAERVSGRTLHVPAIAVEAVNPTGAGDVFAATFVFALRMPGPLMSE